MFNKIKHKLSLKRLNFRNLNIGTKYGLTLVIVFIMFGITTGVVTTLIHNIGKEVSVLDEKGSRAIEITEMGSLTRSKGISILAFEKDGLQQYITEYEEQQEEFDELESKVSGQLKIEKQQKLFELVIANDEEINELFLDNMVPSKISGDNSAAANVVITRVEELRKESIFLLEQLRTSMNEERDLAVNNVERHQKVTTLVLLISMVASIIIGSLLIFFISRVISRNLNQVVEVSNRIADGDLAVEEIDYIGNDEIGRSARAINTMSASLRGMIEQITQIAGVLHNRSEKLTQTADIVMVGSEQVAATAEELASGSEMQAHNAGNLAETMEVFSSKVRDVNSNGEYIYESSQHVLKMTETGGQLMEESVKQMAVIDQIVQDSVTKVKGLDIQSREISNLVSVIKGIADQTNLLALNAAIEAARAGEHGLGFGVVAEEVRNLAEQVAISVTDITGIVERIQEESTGVAESLLGGYKEVERGTNQIKSTGETFKEISDSMGQMVTNIQTVTENLATMSSDSQGMNASIEEIASITEEAAAGIQQTSAASEQSSHSMEEVTNSATELSKLSVELNDLVRQFKL